MTKNELVVYHIVTRNKMRVGQIIDFSENQKNTLYHFFFEKEQLNSKGEDFVRIFQNQYTNEGVNLTKEDAEVGLKYLDQTTRAIRETIVEMVRLEEYPNYPSRLSCLYATKSLEDALKWVDLFNSYNRQVLQLVKLRVFGKSFEGDASFLPKEDGISFAKKIEQAREYWKGNVISGLPEMLVDGKIEVVEILEEYE
ncbi:DUF2441 domain-containing protein [Psychrobacillus sp. MER TA 171]|uniref:DUF2441 domain-containing protein n=1 Tax=Psychrobacillus sp. MER TA 171 TaxID=2939577 RepID=UPI00203F1157|nr:DUF2441 domain-containing protein [Psychrobacillus sp. MER TA 171]MCM3357696.1 DUF2441 domain-containing protein [Psychrobacillus sp. MER TA 171]